MKYLKPLILESKQVGNLYHFTSEINAFLILDKMELMASKYYDDDSDLWKKDKYEYRISFTRNKNLWSELNINQKNAGNIKMDARLKFDGDILSRHYKIVPHDDNWKRENDFIHNKLKYPLNPISKRRYDLGDEREERLYTNKNIVHVNNTLKEITLFKTNKELYDKWINNSKLKNEFIQNCKMYNVKLNIYLELENETIEII